MSEDKTQVEDGASTSQPSYSGKGLRGNPIAIGALVVLIAGGLGFAGYSIGKSTGPDLDVYEQAGTRAGTKVGNARGYENCYEKRLKQRRQKGCASTYGRSYKKSYADAYEAEGLDRPSPSEIEVEK
jgi:hypothetical protein